MSESLHKHLETMEVRLSRRLDRIEAYLSIINHKENVVMSDLTDALDRLEAEELRDTDAEEAAKAAFNRLAQMIADLKMGSTDPAMIARISALSDAVAAKADSMAAAVAATPQ